MDGDPVYIHSKIIENYVLDKTLNFFFIDFEKFDLNFF